MNWTLIGALALVALGFWLACRCFRSRAAKSAQLVQAPALIDHPSPNHSERDDDISFLILHYTAMDTAQAALDRLCDPVAKVSSHYFVGEDGTIWRLVDESKSAWHAGVSFWGGKRNLNGASIGIEIANQGDRPFTAPQMASVTHLCRWILSRHNIKAQHVIGHADIAPGRKPDPGWFFDWKGLAANGVGIVPAPTQADYDKSASWTQSDVRRALTQYGYTSDVEFDKVMDAFQRHFHQEVTPRNGTINKESSARLAWLVRNKR
jgi:N-acetylmuramoyl-L-alanine amidase